MQVFNVSIRVHANSSVTKDHVLPQALDFVLTIDGNIRMTRISGERSIVISESTVLDFWRRWLPSLWAETGTIRGESDGLDWVFFYDTERSRSPRMIVGNGVIDATFVASELESAIILAGSNKAKEISMAKSFEIHDLAEVGSRVVRHNHRIHQHCLDFDEVEL
tara:strand:- start:16232 stop:16723 length:492 start_codon:yes stop_codon:yes gene_type:complete